MLNNQPLTRPTPLSPERWQEGSGPAKGTYFFQGPYDVAKVGAKWHAFHCETRIPNREREFDTVEAAQAACAADRRWALARAQNRAEQRKQMQA